MSSATRQWAADKAHTARITKKNEQKQTNKQNLKRRAGEAAVAEEADAEQSSQLQRRAKVPARGVRVGGGGLVEDLRVEAAVVVEGAVGADKRADARRLAGLVVGVDYGLAEAGAHGERRQRQKVALPPV